MNDLKPCHIDIVKIRSLCLNSELRAYVDSDCIYLADTVSGEIVKIGAAPSRSAQPDNAPITLEELRVMDGEPVWIVAYPDWGHWELSEDADDYFECKDEDFYGMTMPPSLPDQMGRYGLHMLGWLAYRRKPEPEGSPK